MLVVWYSKVRQDALHHGDHTTVIRLASSIILSVTILALVARQITKIVVFCKLAVDDAFALLATIFAIGLSASTIFLASHGLGISGTLPVEQIHVLTKGYYISEIFYIAAICFAKLSLLVIFQTVFQRQRVHSRAVLTFGCFIFVWSVASILAVALQCALPHLWDTASSQCFDSRKFWIIYCTIDAITELLIISSCVMMVAYIQVPMVRKLAIVACFAPRALVICVAIIRLTWLYPTASNDNGQYRLWIPTIIAQVHLCLSICTACIPYMVPFFRAIDRTIWRAYPFQSRKLPSNGSTAHRGSSIWFRRQSFTQEHNPWDSTNILSIEYGHNSIASPRLPMPRPLSPMTPPRVCSPPIRSFNKKGLCISIPLAQRESEYDILSSRTTSSFASPNCLSPQPLLNKQFIPSRKAPSPPLRKHPSNLIATPELASNQSTPRSHQFSLFPTQRIGSHSPLSRYVPSGSPITRSTRSNRSPRAPNNLQTPPMNSSHREAIPAPRNPPRHEFSTITKIKSPDPTTIPQESTSRPDSAQDLNSPMGAALNNFFGATADPVRTGYVPNQPFLLPYTSPHMRMSQTDLQDGRNVLTSEWRVRDVAILKDARSRPSVVEVLQSSQ